MATDRPLPDLAVTVPLDSYAPRSARHCVAQVDNPSPDLRDAVVLLCSEIVTQAVERSEGESVEVRVWMPSDVVRVEVLGSPKSLSEVHREHSDYASMLLDQIADRWELDRGDDESCVWFEIDRHAAAGTAAAG